MKRLIVPIDFSMLSRHAYDFALPIAEALSAEVVLLHAYRVPETVSGDEEQDSAWLDNEKKRLSERLEQFLLAGNTTTQVPVSASLVEDFPEEGVASWAKRQSADLIIMGTEGPHELGAEGTDSHSLRTVNASPVPVLLVPDGCPIALPKTLVFAVDFEDDDAGLVRTLQSLAYRLGARLRVLHVREHAVFDDPTAYRRYQTTFHEILDDERSSFDLVRGSDVAQVLEDTVDNPEDQWLVLRTRHRASAGLTDDSLTRAMAWHTRIPLLSFPGSAS